ncbi:hypothetical protein ACFX1Q_017705 [Malus domestica]
MVLPDGKILVAGSNTNYYYNFTGVKYPTELRVKKFCPPYFDPLLISDRLVITSYYKGKMVKYRGYIVVEFKLKKAKVDQSNLKVTMYSLSQPMKLENVESEFFRVEVVAPPSAEIAHPGFYLIFVVHNGVLSSGIWVQIA